MSYQYRPLMGDSSLVPQSGLVTYSLLDSSGDKAKSGGLKESWEQFKQPSNLASTGISVGANVIESIMKAEAIRQDAIERAKAEHAAMQAKGEHLTSKMKGEASGSALRELIGSYRASLR